MSAFPMIDKAQRWAIIAGTCLAVVSLIGMGILVYGQRRYQAGRNSVTASVRVDTVTVNVIRRADSTAKAHTDTIVKRLTVTRWKVDTLVRQVPDSLLAVPAIKALVGSVKQLSAQVDTLTRTLDVERAVSRLRASTDSAALVSASIVIVGQADSIRTLKQRPQWHTLGLAVVAAGVLGFIGGVLR